MSIKVYTSYFSNVRNIPTDVALVSIAGKTPDWLSIFKCNELMPKYSWWKEWHDTFANNLESVESKQWYIKHYKETVLNTLDAKMLIKHLFKLCNSDKICLLCYETPEKFCHRHIVSEWLNLNGVECSESFYKK